MLGSSAQSDCAILEFSSLLRVTRESPVMHPCPPVTPFCAECPAFPRPRHTHVPGAASGDFSGLQALSPSLGCLLWSFSAQWCLLRPAQAPLAATARCAICWKGTWVAELPLLCSLHKDSGVQEPHHLHLSAPRSSYAAGEYHD